MLYLFHYSCPSLGEKPKGGKIGGAGLPYPGKKAGGCMPIGCGRAIGNPIGLKGMGAIMTGGVFMNGNCKPG